jgi:hypothetical protein
MTGYSPSGQGGRGGTIWLAAPAQRHEPICRVLTGQGVPMAPSTYYAARCGQWRDGAPGGHRGRLLRTRFSHWAMRRRGYSVIFVRNSQALATLPVSAASTGTIST